MFSHVMVGTNDLVNDLHALHVPGRATIVPGNAAKSLLIKSIRHEDPDLKMPAKSPKLDDKIIADCGEFDTVYLRHVVELAVRLQFAELEARHLDGLAHDREAIHARGGARGHGRTGTWMSRLPVETLLLAPLLPPPRLLAV